MNKKYLSWILILVLFVGLFSGIQSFVLQPIKVGAASVNYFINDDYEGMTEADLLSRGYSLVTPTNPTASNKITIEDAPGRVGTKALKVVDSSSGARTEFIRTLNSTATGKVTLEFDWYLDKIETATKDVQIIRMENDSNQAFADLRLDGSGNLAYREGTSNRILILKADLVAATWYSVRIVTDTNTLLSSEIYINGTKMYQSGSTTKSVFNHTDAPSLNSGVVKLRSTATSNGNMSSQFIDNLKLYTASAPAAPQNVNAAAGSTAGSISLIWDAVEGASSYSVLSSTTQGGTYSPVASAANVMGTSVNITGLMGGTRYYFVVKANNSAGSSPNSVEASAVAGLPAPVLDPVGAGDTQATLTWSTVPGAAFYVIKGGTTAGVYDMIAQTSTATYTQTGLTNGTTYYFVVSAWADGTESADSNIQSVTPSTVTEPPARPAAPTVTPGDGIAIISWQPVDQATQYELKLSTAVEGPYSTIHRTETVASYTYSGLTNGTIYYFKIAAANDVGVSLDSDAASVVPVPYKPSAPTFTVTAGHTIVTLSWTSVTGAVYYTPKMGSASGNYTVSDTVYSDGRQNYTHTFNNLTNGTTYYFTVSASNLGGESPNAVERNIKPVAAAAGPAQLIAMSGDGQINLAWTRGNTGVTYNVKGGISPTGPFTTIASGLGRDINYYAHKGLTNGATYYYVVTQTASGAESQNSPIASAVPAVGQQQRIIQNLDVKDTTQVGTSANTRADFWSIQANLQKGDVIFGDRMFKVADMPAKYEGAEWIRTAMDSKGYTGSPLVEFKVAESAVVVVALDARYDTNGIKPPSWLTGWVNTGNTIKDDSSSTAPVIYNLYEKVFTADSIVSLESMKQTASVANYFILALPATMTVDQESGYVRDPKYTVSGTLYSNTSLEIRINESILAALPAQQAARGFNYEVDLVPGENKIEFTATDASGNKSTSFIIVTYDIVAPVISLSPSDPPAEVTDADYALDITLSEGAKLTIKLNDTIIANNVEVEADRVFRRTIVWAEGLNRIEIIAEDYAGNITTQQYSVMYTFAASNVTFRNINGEPVAGLTPQSEVIASVDVVNKTSAAKEVTLFIILYDADNTMIGYAYSTENVEAASTSSLNAAIRVPAEASGHKVKAFVWDSVSGMKPLSGEMVLQ